MNNNLNDAIFNLAKATSIMHSIEDDCLGSLFPRENSENAMRGELLFYALWDELEKVEKELDSLEGDIAAADAVYASESARNGTLKEE